jgi:hypothetical protein
MDMKMKKSYLIVTGFFTLGVIGLLAVVIPSPDFKPPAGVFEKAGYLVLVPFVDEQPPGYFDTVEHSTNREVSLHRTCNIPFAEIEPLIQKTKTVDEQISRKLKAGYEADASVLATNGSVSLDGVRQVHVRYENSEIWYLTTQSLYDIRNRYLRGTCLAAIESDLMKDLPVCQTKKVVVSDIVFEVTYESGTKMKIAATGDSLSGGMNAGSSGTHGIQGKKMFHAVKLDEACFTLNPEQAAT